MFLSFLKDMIKYLTYKVKYLDCTIAFKARVTPVSTLRKDTTIGRNTLIYDSDIGKSVVVNKSCYISKSSLKEHVIIHDSTVIADSQLDKQIVVYNDCHLYKVIMGKFGYIAHGSQLNLVELGSFCSIGPNLICGHGDHPTNFVSTNPVFYSTLKQCGITFTNRNSFEERKKIIIGNDVWIGAGVFIKDGVKIGHGAIIGAGAVVVKDVPDYAIVGGVPAKVIRFRFTQDIIQQLLRIQWWYWSEEELRQAQPYFQTEDVSSFIKWTEINNRRVLSC